METIELRNKYTNDIIDILGKKVKSKKQLINNREKVIKLLNTSINIDAEHLENSFKYIIKEFPEDILLVKNLEDFRNNVIKFMAFVLEVGEDFSDGGYSILLSYYFYLSGYCLENLF